MTDHIDLPDDPRDCHRAICKVFGQQCFEWPQAGLPLAALHMAELYARVNGSATDEAGWATKSLALIVAMAQEVAQDQHEAMTRVQALARHGTTDHLEWDAASARRMAAHRNGEPIPNEPTLGDVAAAQRILKALGHSWTMQEVVACLRDAEAQA